MNALTRTPHRSNHRAIEPAAALAACPRFGGLLFDELHDASKRRVEALVNAEEGCSYTNWHWTGDRGQGTAEYRGSRLEVPARAVI